jgi:haloalkane dehalogenase
MHHIDHGPRDGHPIVLVHGLPAWGYLYRHMIDRLVECGHRVLVPDLVGFGRSDKPTASGAYSLDAHVAWMGAWFDRVVPAGATIAVHDWGGLVTLCAVAADPRRAARLVLFDTSLNDGTEALSEPYRRGFDAWKAYLGSDASVRPSTIIETQLPGGLAEADRIAYDAPFPDESHRAGLRINDTLYPLSPDDPGATTTSSARRVLAATNIAVLICFSAAADRYHPSMHDRFRQLFAGRLRGDVVLDRTGHFLQEQEPDRISAMIDDFVAATGRRP